MLPRYRRTTRQLLFAENGYMLRRENNFTSNVLRINLRHIERDEYKSNVLLRRSDSDMYALQRHLEKPVSEHLDRYNPSSRLRYDYQRKGAQTARAYVSKATTSEGGLSSLQEKRSGKAKLTLAIYKNTQF